MGRAMSEVHASARLRSAGHPMGLNHPRPPPVLVAAALPRLRRLPRAVTARARVRPPRWVAQSLQATCRGLMESRDELLSELALINRQLQASDESTSDLIDALVAAARALKLPTDAPREDTHRFIDGAEAVENATWAQCGGLVVALADRQVVDERAFAARLAERIFELTPTHH